MKKKIMLSVAIIAILALAISSFTACGGKPQVEKSELYPDDFVKVDYSSMEVVDNMDAFDLMCEVYDNWVADKGYRREQIFTFEAKAGLVPVANNTCYELYKIDGDDVYKRRVVIQTGMAGDKNEITRFYYDGQNAFKVIQNDAKNIPGKGTGMEIFNVIEEPKMLAHEGSDEMTIDEELYSYTQHMTTYDWTDKDNLVDTDGYKVYKDKEGNLRFTITINCSQEMMESVHYDAWKEFETSTDADENSIKMRENTTIDFVVKNIGGKNKVVAWRRSEQYKGGRFNMDLINAAQTCTETFTYDEDSYKITEQETK